MLLCGSDSKQIDNKPAGSKNRHASNLKRAAALKKYLPPDKELTSLPVCSKGLSDNRQ
jgi:hypothetical protein